jgi:hypothetical protein
MIVYVDELICVHLRTVCAHSIYLHVIESIYVHVNECI